MEETSTDMELRKRMLNDRLMLAERGFLDADGLLGNRWFKHLVSVVLFFKKNLNALKKRIMKVKAITM